VLFEKIENYGRITTEARGNLYSFMLLIDHCLDVSLYDFRLHFLLVIPSLRYEYSIFACRTNGNIFIPERTMMNAMTFTNHRTIDFFTAAAAA
jgi:hypothetical protein